MNTSCRAHVLESLVIKKSRVDDNPDSCYFADSRKILSPAQARLDQPGAEALVHGPRPPLVTGVNSIAEKTIKSHTYPSGCPHSFHRCLSTLIKPFASSTIRDFFFSGVKSHCDHGPVPAPAQLFDLIASEFGELLCFFLCFFP